MQKPAFSYSCSQYFKYSSKHYIHSTKSNGDEFVWLKPDHLPILAISFRPNLALSLAWLKSVKTVFNWNQPPICGYIGLISSAWGEAMSSFLFKSNKRQISVVYRREHSKWPKISCQGHWFSFFFFRVVYFPGKPRKLDVFCLTINWAFWIILDT